MSTPTTGYYSVIQYCPDRSRLEAANVGVLLFAPTAGYLRAKFASGNDRVRRFFSEEVRDFEQVQRAKDMLVRRIEKEAEALATGDLGALEHFLCLFANEFIFSPLRAVRVEQPETELVQLFEELVGGRVRRDPRAVAPVVARIHARFAAPDLAPRVRRKVSVRVPVLGEKFEADYAFQNGRLNLIQLKEFSQIRDSDWLKDACRAAAEGRMRYKHPDAQNGAQQLVVVGAFRDAQDEREERVAQLLREHDVLFFPESQLDALARRIIETAH